MLMASSRTTLVSYLLCDFGVEDVKQWWSLIIIMIYYQWQSMIFHIISWLFMQSHDYSCSLMINAVSWLFMQSHDYSCSLMIIHAISWLFMCSLLIHAVSWLFMQSHDYSCSLMIIHAVSWLFMQSHDYSYNLIWFIFMQSHDYSWFVIIILTGTEVLHNGSVCHDGWHGR